MGQSKEKLQTSAVTSKGIQIPNWKKQRIESLIYSSYHHTPGSTINITSVDASTSTKTLLARIAFQNLNRDHQHHLDFDHRFISQISELSEFNYQNLILKNPNIQIQQHLENSEIKTPNIRTLPNQRNQNPELIHQQNLPLVIVIDQPPVEPIGEPIQPPQVLLQQSLPLQQPLQQPPQPPNLDPMAYTPITKLDNFTGEEDDAQVWLNNYQSLINKPQDFNAFKVEFLKYFSNNNSINCLINTFTTMKQGESEAILNQFICGLHSSILQHICPLHPGTLQDAVTYAKDFESTKSEANHTQVINLVMNRSPELDSKLEKFKDALTNNPAFTQKQPLISNIPPTTITKDKFLAAIFPFEFEETTAMPLFSGAALKAKPITTMYIDAKVEGQSIKLIFDIDRAASARIITANGVTKTPISEIDDFPFEVNGIMTPIKVLVIEVTQYQALVATCGHFKTPSKKKLLIKLEEKKKKSIWKAYQVSWANADHNELPPILSWNDNLKGKQKEELTWETDNLIWTDNEQEEPSS
ncbi:hypothetical protein G9A89_012401 [Geosiphon pyriformis]|nr:hypothetical protein G9A89_012401 [Geosiphon pyriformis]